MINNGEDGIVAFAFGERRNQVHCHHLEWKCFWGHWDFVEGDACSMGQSFILLAYRTPFMLRLCRAAQGF